MGGGVFACVQACTVVWCLDSNFVFCMKRQVSRYFCWGGKGVGGVVSLRQVFFVFIVHVGTNSMTWFFFFHLCLIYMSLLCKGISQHFSCIPPFVPHIEPQFSAVTHTHTHTHTHSLSLSLSFSLSLSLSLSGQTHKVVVDKLTTFWILLMASFTDDAGLLLLMMNLLLLMIKLPLFVFILLMNT